MSSTIPGRPVAVSAMSRSRRVSLSRPRKNSVSWMNPAATTLAVICRAPSSRARSMFHDASPALAAPYAPAPLSAAIDPMCTTEPPGPALFTSTSSCPGSRSSSAAS
jgi:hypothetical protein